MKLDGQGHIVGHPILLGHGESVSRVLRDHPPAVDRGDDGGRRPGRPGESRRGKPLGRARARTLRRAADPVGLHANVRPPPRAMRPTRSKRSGAAMRRGLFRLSDPRRSMVATADGELLAKSLTCVVTRCSVGVVFPAYSGTAARARCLDDRGPRRRGAGGPAGTLAAQARRLLAAEPPGPCSASTGARRRGRTGCSAPPRSAAADWASSVAAVFAGRARLLGAKAALVREVTTWRRRRTRRPRRSPSAAAPSTRSVSSSPRTMRAPCSARSSARRSPDAGPQRPTSRKEITMRTI